MLCKNCAHWERSDACYGECNNNKIDCSFPSGNEEKPDYLYCLPNNDNYGISFTIGEEFGCIHWAPIKPEVNKIKYPVSRNYGRQAVDCRKNGLRTERGKIFWCERFDTQCKSSVCLADRNKLIK